MLRWRYDDLSAEVIFSGGMETDDKMNFRRRRIPSSSLASAVATLALSMLLLLLPAAVLCGGHASIKSKYGQLVTSSTLRWRATTAREFSLQAAVPREAVRSGTGNQERVVCRADHHGAMALGQTVEGGHCAVAFINKLMK